MKIFTQYGLVKNLDHKMLVMLIDKIYVADNRSIQIVFRYKNEFEHLEKIINSVSRERELAVCAG